MDSVEYTRSTLLKDYFDFYNPDDVINVVDLGDKLVSPDNELLVEKTVILDNYILHKPQDVVDVNDIDKYFIEIAWYDSKYSKWFSAVLIPETWQDVLKAQYICEGRTYQSEHKPFKYTQMKELYPLANSKNPQLVRWNVSDAKKSLEDNAEHIYVTRGIHSGILTNHKFENMVHKSVLDTASFTWVSAWTLERAKVIGGLPPIQPPCVG